MCLRKTILTTVPCRTFPPLRAKMGKFLSTNPIPLAIWTQSLLLDLSVIQVRIQTISKPSRTFLLISTVKKRQVNLASILDLSLRRQPSSDGVKSTCGKIKPPSNVPSLKVPMTNTAITKAMSIGGRLIDTRLSLTNGLITKALIPIAHCTNDIGEKNGRTIQYYLEGLNSTLRLLTSTVKYVIQLRKEVARIHINDSALAELCKWECEVVKDELFPFDVVKKCEEVHKAKKLGRPTFRPYKTSRRRFAQNRQNSRRPYQPLWHQYRPRCQTRPFLDQRPPLGKGRHMQKTHQSTYHR